MARRTWIFVDSFFNENELKSFLVQNEVSVKRTEETKEGKKVTYRCSKYRKGWVWVWVCGCVGVWVCGCVGVWV